MGSRLTAAWFTILVGLITVGCRQITSDGALQFSQSCNAARQQMDTAFAGVNLIAAEDALKFATSQPTLNEENVATVLKAEDIAKWDRAFNELEAYGGKVAALLSPQLASDFQQSVSGLATELQAIKPDAVPSAGIATAFTQLGQVMIQAFAEREAQAVAQRTDPHVRALLTE